MGLILNSWDITVVGEKERKKCTQTQRYNHSDKSRTILLLPYMNINCLNNSDDHICVKDIVRKKCLTCGGKAVAGSFGSVAHLM